MQTVLLVGFPNSGKSTIFNLLSGQSKKVSNYSGITVDSAVGLLKSNEQNDKKIEIVDLPGIYNLSPSSLDEGVTISSILGLNHSHDHYHLVAVVLDMDRLDASLSLTLALKEIIPQNLVLIINKDDKKSITSIEKEKLEKLTGLQIISYSALHDNADCLDSFIRENVNHESIEISGKIKITNETLQYVPAAIRSQHIQNQTDDSEILSDINQYHFEARKIIKQVFIPDEKKSLLTSKIDSIILHPILGSLIFCAIFYLIFDSIYTWAGPLMDLIDSFVGGSSEWVGTVIPEGHLNSLITDGIMAGVGGVIIFLPQIMILFFLLSILEQSGYIARAAVLTDKIMGFFGLNGKAFLPYMSGFACAVPAIMSARTIPNKKERLATILTLPLITCSARLPVYILLIGTFVPSYTVWGLFNSQALSFFFLYFLGSIFALVLAKIFRLTFYKGESSNFIIDLPVYQMPSLLTAWKQSYSKGMIFIKKAGTIILTLSMVIWFASTFPKPSAEMLAGQNEEQVAAITLQQSLLGTVGRTIEPVLKPIGMDWKMGIGVLVAFGARELFVSTMGTIYALGDVDEESTTLRERLKNEKNSITGEPVYSLAVAWSLLIFFVFSLQCTSTLAILKRETGGWKIPIMMFTYMGILGYVGSFIAYRLLL